MPKLQRSLRSEASGFTILEVVIAMAILGLGMLAIAAAQISSLRISSQSRYLTESMNLAHQQMETFQLTPLTSLPAPGSYNDAANPIQPDATNSTTYSRSWIVTANNPSPGITRLEVQVDWVDGTGTTRSTRLESYKGF
jgi:prepilin-type N-terminal cleavage/methylation domain-containing protein